MKPTREEVEKFICSRRGDVDSAAWDDILTSGADEIAARAFLAVIWPREMWEGPDAEVPTLGRCQAECLHVDFLLFAHEKDHKLMMKWVDENATELLR